MTVSIYKDQYDIYIGRAGKGQDGYFGNPIKVNEVCKECGAIHATPESTLPCFNKYFLRRIGNDLKFKERVLTLKGKVLGCFCAPKGGLTHRDPWRCHGQVIEHYLYSN